MSNESLSALFDGECSDAELDRLLSELDRDPALAECWSRWQLRRDLQEGVSWTQGQACICAGVMSQLEEPVRHGARVIDLAAWRRRVVALPWKPAAGLAAAASMGAAAVLFVGAERAAGVGGRADGAPVDFSPGIGVGDPLGLPGSSGRLQSVSFSSQPGASDAPSFADDEYRELLRDYLINHNNALSDSGVGGTLRYARFAAYNADYRGDTAEGEGQR